MMRRLLAFAAAAALPSVAHARELPADPLHSPMWAFHAARIFGDAAVVFDDRVKVELPMLAEDQHRLPVTIDARALPDVRRIVLFADLNPIPVAIDYQPLAAAAVVGTRIKLDQRTPVRGAVLTGDGVWHVAGDWVDAAGGGCSAPPLSRVRGDWADHLGEMRGAAWPEGKETRLRVAIRHPMDTGLVENIPGYNIESLTVRETGGRELAMLTIYGSVSEDPAFTLIVDPQGSGPLSVVARDTSGLEFDGALAT